MPRHQFKHSTSESLIEDETTREPGANQREQRRHVRKRVLLAGRIETKDGTFDCVVLDVSRSGARLHFNAPIPDQTTVNLAFGSFGTLNAKVIWQRSDKMGICFTAEPAQIANIIGQAIPV